MNVLQNNRKQSVRGLTLIELVVVLAILVALVGLVLAFFPGLLSRASKSTSASSIQDVARAVQINYTSQLTYGTGYDSLLNVGGVTLYSNLTVAASTQLDRAVLTTADAAALNVLGINNLFNMQSTATDATFNVSQISNSIPVANATPVATINAVAGLAVRNAVRGNYTPAGAAVYVVVGLNKAASIVGGNSILQDAPVRAGSNAQENPTISYQRYGLVFLIDGAAARTARFLGAVAFASSGITTAESNLEEYYK